MFIDVDWCRYRPTGRELRSSLLALCIKSLERLLSKRTITG